MWLGTTRVSLLACWNLIPIRQDDIHFVQPICNIAVGSLTSDIPIENLADDLLFNRMRNHYLSIPFIRLTKIGTVIHAIRVSAAGTQAIAITKGGGSQPQSLAGTLAFPFANFLAQVVNINLGQCSENGQHQLTPGGGEVETFLHGNERDSTTVELIQRGQQSIQMAVEAIHLIHDHYVELVLLGILHHPLEGGTPAALLG